MAKSKDILSFEAFRKALHEHTEPIYEGFEEKFRQMLAIQKERDTIIHEELQITYPWSLEENRYFFLVLHWITEYCDLYKFYVFWEDEPLTDWQLDQAQYYFNGLTNNVLSYCLACTDGDIEKCLDYPTVIPAKGPTALQDQIINLLTVVNGGDGRFIEPGPFDAISSWIGIIQSLELDFDEDVYKPFVKEEPAKHE